MNVVPLDEGYIFVKKGGKPLQDHDLATFQKKKHQNKKRVFAVSWQQSTKSFRPYVSLFFFWCSSSFFFSSFCLRWIWCSRWIWYSWWSNRFDTIRSIRLLLHHSGLHQLIIKPIMLHQGGLKYECFDVHCNCQHDDQWQEFWRVVHVWKQQHNDSVLISDTKFEVRLS